MKVSRTVLSVVSVACAYLFGELDASLKFLLVMMALDYITGCVDAFMHKSDKTQNGGLNSSVGFKGLIKKAGILACVLVAHQIGVYTDADYIRESVIFGFGMNEALSILENLALMGVNIPEVLLNLIDNVKKEEKQ